MRPSLIFILLVLVPGCASQTSYRRLPAQYTDVQSSPVNESYLIEIIHAFGPPSAMRFDFDRTGESVAIQIFEADGPGAPQKKTGQEAARLLFIFRAFDWNSLGIERPLALYPDDAALVLKAQKAGAYREASGGAMEHPTLSALLRSVSESLNEPNQPSQPTAASGRSSP